MRDIKISTEVFALIWSNRMEGEETENQILKRILSSMISCSETSASATASTVSFLKDKRSGTIFEEGFTIFRTYKGRDFHAKVMSGFWRLEGFEEKFSSLNELSKAIGTKTENAWANWFYWGEDGQRQAVSTLRDPKSISKKTTPSERKNRVMNPSKNRRWCDDIKQALLDLGGSAHLHQIYREVRKIRSKAGRSLPESTEEVIRKELEVRSSDSQAYNSERNEDWFALPNGKGVGYWALRG